MAVVIQRQRGTDQTRQQFLSCSTQNFTEQREIQITDLIPFLIAYQNIRRKALLV